MDTPSNQTNLYPNYSNAQSMAVDKFDVKRDFRREVPGLHPGLNDLIRALGKQAHCASRTLIVCEPVCPRPTYSESKYHKNCGSPRGSPRKGRSWDSLCRPSSLWSPVRPESYYYDCFFYRQYPDREAEYQDIEEKYNAIKQEKLDYTPPECDEKKLKGTSGGLMNKSGSAGKGGKSGKRDGAAEVWSGPGAFRNKDNLGESSVGSQRSQKYPTGTGSKRNLGGDDSVPCSELAEIRDLLKQSDRETIRRMQEMLMLMKELSVRDICKATCDGSSPRRRSKVRGAKGAKSDEDYDGYYGSQAPYEEESDYRKQKARGDSDYDQEEKKKRYRPGGDSMRHTGDDDDDESGPLGSKKNFRKRDGEDEDFAPQGSKKSYRQRDDEDFGPQGTKKSYRPKDDDFKLEGSKKGYPPRDDGDDFGPQGSKRRYRDGDDEESGRQGSKSTYQQRDGDDSGVGPPGPKRSYLEKEDEDSGPRGLKKSYWKKDDEDLGPQGSKKSYQPRDDVDDFGPQGSKKSYRQRDGDDDFEPKGLKKRYWPKDGDGGEYGPQGSKKSYGQKDGDDTDFGPQRSKKRYPGRMGDDDSPQESKKSRQRDGDDDLGPQGSKKSYRERDDSANFGAQGSKTSYLRREGDHDDDDYEPEDSRRSYKQRDDGPGPQESQKPYQRESDLSRRKKRKYNSEDEFGDRYDDECGDVSESPHQQKESAKKRKGDPDEDASLRQASIRSTQQREPERKKRQIADDGLPAEYDEQIRDEYTEPTLELDMKTPRSLQRHPDESRGRVADDSESTTTSSDSERSRTRMRRDQSSRREKGRKAVSDSDTDLSDKSSIYSESSTTPSLMGKGEESDCDDSDMEFEVPRNTSSSQSVLKRRGGGSVASSQASVSVKGSAMNLGRTHSDVSRPGMQGEDQFSPGANYRIPVGKKNVPLTVHEVVELSNKITDIIVLEIINELIKNAMYILPSKRDTYLKDPHASMPRTSVESQLRSKSPSSQILKDRKADTARDHSGHTVDRVKSSPQHSPSRLSRIDESTSRTSKLSQKKDGSLCDTAGRDLKQGEKRHSGGSRRLSCPRHSKSLSPSTSQRRRSSSCRLEIERRARSEGDSARRGESPKPWERRLSSQMKLDSMRDASRADAEDKSGSRRGSESSRKSKAGSYKAPTTRPDHPKESSVKGSASGRQTGIKQNIREGSISSQKSKMGSQRPSSKRPDQEALGESSLENELERQPTLAGSKQKVTESSPKSQYEAPPQEDTPGSRGPSISSQRSKTALKDGSPGRQPSVPEETEPPQDRPELPRRTSVSSQRSKTQPDQASLKDGIAPGTGGRGPSVESQMSEKSSRKDVSGTRIEKEASGSRNLKEGSWPQGMLKGSSDTPQPKPPEKPVEAAIPSGAFLSVPTKPLIRPLNKTPSGRLIDPDAEEGKLVTIRTKEKLHQPDSNKGMQSAEPCQPCKPDDFVATDYDTDNSILYYARLTGNAFPPVKETYHSAGFLLRSAYHYTIPSRSKMSVKTDLLVQVPRNSYGRIAPRKCLVENYGIDVAADVIDRDFRGNITVVLFNHGDKPFNVERGNKVAQLICESIHLAKVVENNDLLK